VTNRHNRLTAMVTLRQAQELQQVLAQHIAPADLPLEAWLLTILYKHLASFALSLLLLLLLSLALDPHIKDHSSLRSGHHITPNLNVPMPLMCRHSGRAGRGKGSSDAALDTVTVGLLGYFFI
jgi:hypothetical protein